MILPISQHIFLTFYLFYIPLFTRRRLSSDVANEDLFSVIKRAHIATGHAGRDRMSEHIATKYANIGMCGPF